MQRMLTLEGWIQYLEAKGKNKDDIYKALSKEYKQLRKQYFGIK